MHAGPPLSRLSAAQKARQRYDRMCGREGERPRPADLYMMEKKEKAALLLDPLNLKRHIRSRIAHLSPPANLVDLTVSQRKTASVVLFVLSQCRSDAANGGLEPCLILNKRSARVRQRGDLCCPGGGISWRRDRLLAKVLELPGSPLRRSLSRSRPFADLNVLLAAGLREAWEEMRLNPLRFDFLGMLPPQELVMFKRVIYPLVGWSPPQPLKPNWEVERIVHIPLRHLLDPGRYGRFRPTVAAGGGASDVQPLRHHDFPCFLYQGRQGREMLWGATFRITQSFLHLVFDFNTPPIESLPLAERLLDDAYLNGSRWHPRNTQRDDPTDW